LNGEEPLVIFTKQWSEEKGNVIEKWFGNAVHYVVVVGLVICHELHAVFSTATPFQPDRALVVKHGEQKTFCFQVCTMTQDFNYW
jgi:hypothetical protein